MLLDAVLMCHAPIVIPHIAKARQSSCALSTQGMRRAAQKVTAQDPDLILIVSPHTPRWEDGFGIVPSAPSGDFGRFGEPSIRVSAPTDVSLCASIREHANKVGLPCRDVNVQTLDHGSAVPLFFIQETRWRKNVIICTIPYPSQIQSCVHFGASIASLMSEKGVRWSLVASGDMSHALSKDAPCGFHPSGERFDAHFVDAIAHGDYEKALYGEACLRREAAEDVVDSVAVAFGALSHAGQTDGRRPPCEIYSYEGPFGVGYTTAHLI